MPTFLLGLGEGMRKNGCQGRGQYLIRTLWLKVVFILTFVI